MRDLIVPDKTINSLISCADPEGATGGPDPPPPPKYHKNIGSLSNTGPDTERNHKATEPAFNVGLSWARQQNAI